MQNTWIFTLLLHTPCPCLEGRVPPADHCRSCNYTPDSFWYHLQNLSVSMAFSHSSFISSFSYPLLTASPFNHNRIHSLPLPHLFSVHTIPSFASLFSLGLPSPSTADSLGQAHTASEAAPCPVAALDSNSTRLQQHGHEQQNPLHTPPLYPGDPPKPNHEPEPELQTCFHFEPSSIRLSHFPITRKKPWTPTP